MKAPTIVEIKPVEEAVILEYLRDYLGKGKKPPIGKFIAHTESGSVRCIDTTYHADGSPVYNTWPNATLGLDWLAHQKTKSN